jgi:hypothetical protein
LPPTTTAAPTPADGCDPATPILVRSLPHALGISTESHRDRALPLRHAISDTDTS